MARMITIGTLLLVLGSASLAAAECAWMLWQETEHTEVPIKKLFPQRIDWTNHSTYVTHDACETAKLSLWSKHLASWEGVREANPALKEINGVPGEFLSVRFRSGDGGVYISKQQFHCLPDTIDSREKQ